MKKNLPYFVLFFLFGSILQGGCSKNNSSDQTTETPTTSVVSSAATSGTAAIKGKIFFDGEVPAPEELPIRGNPECAALHPGGTVYSEELLVSSGMLQNAFVYIKEGLEGRAFEAPTAPATLSNFKCVYVPHVIGVQVGQPLQLVNEDPTLHNIHSYSKSAKPFNLGLPFQGMKQTKKFDAPEIMVSLKCDVHPWMIGYVGVVAHPFFAVTSDKGEFEIKNLPEGEYLLKVWHEKLGTQSQKITIGPQETKEVEFRFAA